MAENMDGIGQYLTFALGDEEYAISVSMVREVLEVPRVTKIPRMPPFMRGVINLRGTVVPVIDLRVKFGMPETAIEKSPAIIVLEIPTGSEGDERLCVGAFSDAVNKVITLEESAISPPPRIGTMIDTAFIRGMGQGDGDFVVILDVASIFSEGDLDAIGNVAENVETLD